MSRRRCSEPATHAHWNSCAWRLWKSQTSPGCPLLSRAPHVYAPNRRAAGNATGPARAVTYGHMMLCIRSWASCNNHVTSRARLLIAGCMSYCRTPPSACFFGTPCDMRADRGVAFVWPISNVHVGQYLDASGPTVFAGFSLE